MTHTHKPFFAVDLQSESFKEKASPFALFICTFGPLPAIPCLFRPNEKS